MIETVPRKREMTRGADSRGERKREREWDRSKRILFGGKKRGERGFINTLIKRMHTELFAN